MQCAESVLPDIAAGRHFRCRCCYQRLLHALSRLDCSCHMDCTACVQFRVGRRERRREMAEDMCRRSTAAAEIPAKWQKHESKLAAGATLWQLRKATVACTTLTHSPLVPQCSYTFHWFRYALLQHCYCVLHAYNSYCHHVHRCCFCSLASCTAIST